MEKISEAKIKKIRNLKIAGLRLEAIGAIIGCSPKTARKYLNKFPITEEEMMSAKSDFPIKYVCASCGKPFYNSEERYLEAGNYCPDCISKINYIEKFKLAEKRGYTSNEKIILSILKERWGIGREYVEIYHSFGNNLKSIFGVED
jgi:DNA-directed RNA polymerase subunit RPC12/RpoP